MSLTQPFDLARYLEETDAMFARIQANIARGQRIVNKMYKVAETPEQRRFEGRTEQKPEEKSVA